ncbi:MAG: GxxExxY protein [candidate division Zixibacteria bacterium]|nr:GxxExxY protein [Candidatus Tariuqbacter arcticus]
MEIPKHIDELEYRIIGICFDVHSELGPGFPEEYYQKSLEYEFTKRGIAFEPQKPIQVFYKEIQVGLNYLDFLVEEQLILEIKSVRALDNVHKFQVIKYLASSSYNFALLVNFGQDKMRYEKLIPPAKIQNFKNIK